MVRRRLGAILSQLFRIPRTSDQVYLAISTDADMGWDKVSPRLSESEDHVEQVGRTFHASQAIVSGMSIFQGPRTSVDAYGPRAPGDLVIPGVSGNIVLTYVAFFLRCVIPGPSLATRSVGETRHLAVHEEHETRRQVYDKILESQESA
jgi:hypothetical protein